MKQLCYFALTGAFAFTFFACGEDKTKTDSAGTTLKADERELCAEQHIDTSLILLLRETFRGKLDVFVPDSVYSFDADDNWSARASQLQGIMFEAPSGTAANLCENYGDEFHAKGHTIYVFEQNFGIDYEKDKVAIVNTADKFEILRETATDGINYDMTTTALSASSGRSMQNTISRSLVQDSTGASSPLGKHLPIGM